PTRPASGGPPSPRRRRKHPLLFAFLSVQISSKLKARCNSDGGMPHPPGAQSTMGFDRAARLAIMAE
ncbi:MAG: hypothetical protein ACYC8V_12410, partial [Caulobacteraceae bacterium]